jgi:hypothetical protein
MQQLNPAEQTLLEAFEGDEFESDPTDEHKIYLAQIAELHQRAETPLKCSSCSSPIHKAKKSPGVTWA